MHEIASIIFKICIVPGPATTSGAGLLLHRTTGMGAELHIYIAVLCFTIDLKCTALIQFS